VTIKFTWDKPNPYFIEKPGARRTALSVPAGTLPQEIPQEVHAGRGDRKAGQGRPGRQLGADHRRVDVMYNNDNPELPTLNAWKLMTPGAGAALRVRAQRLLLPDRREGPAAALSRP
jgi:peptide/nickel transport system substrate-binding protein